MLFLRVVLCAGLAIALLSGCEGPGTVAAPASPGDTVPSASTPSPLDGEEAAQSLDGTPVPTPRDVALLTDVRAARQDGFDRVTFEFAEPPLPTYDIRTIERPILQPGSGDEVIVDGREVLLVRLEPASGFDLDEASEVYQGPTRIVTDTDVITEVVRVGDFEGQLEWAIGLRGEADYDVRELADPPRIVVDVRR